MHSKVHVCILIFRTVDEFVEALMDYDINGSETGDKLLAKTNGDLQRGGK